MNGHELQSAILNEVERIESVDGASSLQMTTVIDFSNLLTRLCYDYYEEDENLLNELRTLDQLKINLIHRQKKTAYIKRRYFAICHIVNRNRNKTCSNQDRSSGTDTCSRKNGHTFSLSVGRSFERTDGTPLRPLVQWKYYQ